MNKAYPFVPLEQALRATDSVLVAKLTMKEAAATYDGSDAIIWIPANPDDDLDVVRVNTIAELDDGQFELIVGPHDLMIRVWPDMVVRVSEPRKE